MLGTPQGQSAAKFDDDAVGAGSSKMFNDYYVKLSNLKKGASKWKMIQSHLHSNMQQPYVCGVHWPTTSVEDDVGIGLGEEMTKPHYTEDGEYLPPYGFINDDDFKKTQPKDAICILYSLKASGSLKPKIHSNTYTRISSGLVHFLIKEQEAKSALLATKVGQKMTVEQRIKRLLPHEMTTKLFEEMSNLRLKRTGASLDIQLEPINTRYPDDKYSSFSYGLWRIKELEEEQAQKARRRSGIGGRTLTFFTGGT